jgi:hypothetical protein
VAARVLMVAMLALGLTACRGGTTATPVATAVAHTAGNAPGGETSAPQTTAHTAVVVTAGGTAGQGTASPATTDCPVTPYADGPPTGSENDRAIAGLRRGPWYGGDALWAFPWLGKDPPGTLRCC